MSRSTAPGTQTRLPRAARSAPATCCWHRACRCVGACGVRGARCGTAFYYYNFNHPNPKLNNAVSEARGAARRWLGMLAAWRLAGWTFPCWYSCHLLSLTAACSPAAIDCCAAHCRVCSLLWNHPVRRCRGCVSPAASACWRRQQQQQHQRQHQHQQHGSDRRRRCGGPGGCG